MSRTRIYVDKEFAKELKHLAVSNDKSVIALTKNLEVNLRKDKFCFPRKNSGWEDL